MSHLRTNGDENDDRAGKYEVQGHIWGRGNNKIVGPLLCNVMAKYRLSNIFCRLLADFEIFARFSSIQGGGKANFSV